MIRTGFAVMVFASALLAAPVAGAQRVSFAETAIGAMPKDFTTA
jgi:hypothetical protein